MARFEQRISEEEVSAAREKIAAGASLRSAAAEIPCAASTLSARIKKAEAAEADALGRSASGANEERAAQGEPARPDALAIAAGEGERPGDVGPIEVLLGALEATKGNGQPDWPTRLSAARLLAALRPELLEPKQEQPPPEPSIVVYDLPPGAAPVLHRAPPGADASLSPADAEPAPHPTSSRYHMFDYESPEGETVLIGTWFPPDRGESEFGAEWAVHCTGDREEAERWRAELSVGRLPEGGDEVPEGHEATG